MPLAKLVFARDQSLCASVSTACDAINNGEVPTHQQVADARALLKRCIPFIEEGKAFFLKTKLLCVLFTIAKKAQERDQCRKVIAAAPQV